MINAGSVRQSSGKVRAIIADSKEFFDRIVLVLTMWFDWLFRVSDRMLHLLLLLLLWAGSGCRALLCDVPYGHVTTCFLRMRLNAPDPQPITTPETIWSSRSRSNRSPAATHPHTPPKGPARSGRNLES